MKKKKADLNRTGISAMQQQRKEFHMYSKY